MNLTKIEEPVVIDSLSLLRGTPIPFQDICLIYPVSMGDIADITEDVFKQYLQLLIGDPAELFDTEETISPIVFIVKYASMNSKYKELVHSAFRLFIHEEITLLPMIDAICVGDVQEKRLLTQENFEAFQYIIKRMHNLSVVQAHTSPADKRAQEIIDKINKYRKTVQEIKASQGNDEGIDLSTLISSLGWKIGLSNVWNLSYYAFYDQIHRLQYEEEYETNLRASLAGAKIPKGKMKYWIRPIQDTDKGGK